jgi:hypothetical protein
MQNLNLKFVYGNLKEVDKLNIINMWLSACVLPKEEAIKRVEQVSVLIFNHTNEIVGVSTIYPAYLTSNNPYFFFRMFIKQEFRGTNIKTKVMQLNFHKLKNKFDDKLNGIVVELENEKLARLGENSNYMSKRGFTYYGKSARNLQLWYVNFDEPKGIFG